MQVRVHNNGKHCSRRYYGGTGGPRHASATSDKNAMPLTAKNRIETHRIETNSAPSEDGAERARPRAPQTSGGLAHELSGLEAAAHIKCDVPWAAQRPCRPTDQYLQAVCCRCLDGLTSSSAVQEDRVERSADHPFATGCCQLMLPAARRPSTVGETTVWASGSMTLLPNAAGEVPHGEEAARSPQARCCRVQRSTSAALVWTASAVAESVSGSTPDAHFGHALCAVGTHVCARAVCEVSGRCSWRS